jgi:hypothetical protein
MSSRHFGRISGAPRGDILLTRVVAMSFRGVFVWGLNICLFNAFVAAQAAAPVRKVVGHAIISERDPRVRIELPQSLEYVGADRFVLYGIADCELHAFVNSDAQKTLQQLYWVQFESYLPSKPDLHHTYDSPRHTMIGGLDFYVDTWVRAGSDQTTPGSDLEHIQALLRAKKYRLPAGMMSVRLVHLLDKAKRKELMIIYSEDVAPTGFTAADLHEGGRAHDRWPTIEKGLIARAEENIHIEERK